MSEVQTAHPPLYTLRITDTRNGRSQSAEVRHALTLVGTREGCWIRPHSSRLSPVHCAIIHTGDIIVVRDLMSDAGTLVNETPIATHELRDTDRINVAHWEFIAVAERDSPTASDRDGPNRWLALIDAEGEIVFESDAPVALVGSNVRCDLVLNDGQASSAHALIVRVDGQWAIADLLTSHGTRVNEQPVEKVRRLNSDDTIRIGALTYTVALRAEPSPVVPPPIAREAEQLAHDRDELAKRREELDARSTALDSNTEALHAEQQQLQEQRKEQEALRQTVQSEREALGLREEADCERSQDLDERTNDVRQREADLEHRKAWVDELAVKLQTENVEFDRASEQLSHDREALATQEQEFDPRSAALASREQETQLKCESLQIVQQRLQEERDAQLAAADASQSERNDLAKLEKELKAQSSDIAVAQEQLKRQSESLSAERLRIEKLTETQGTLRTNVQSEHRALGRWEEELRQKEQLLTTVAEKLRAEFIALRQRARAPGSPLPEASGNRSDDKSSSSQTALVDRDWLEFFSG